MKQTRDKHERQAVGRWNKGEEIGQSEPTGPEAQRTQKRGRTTAPKGFTYSPGNSVSEVGERMKGGAVKEDKSPENEAILIAAEGQREWLEDQEGDSSARFQEGGPRSALICWDGLNA